MPITVPFLELLLCSFCGSRDRRIRLTSGFLLSEKGRIIKEVPNTMAKAGSRIKITLRCSECKQRNYNTNKNKRNTTERLELNKYCPFCRKHTLHTETK